MSLTSPFSSQSSKQQVIWVLRNFISRYLLANKFLQGSHSSLHVGHKFLPCIFNLWEQLMQRMWPPLQLSTPLSRSKGTSRHTWHSRWRLSSSYSFHFFKSCWLRISCEADLVLFMVGRRLMRWRKRKPAGWLRTVRGRKHDAIHPPLPDTGFLISVHSIDGAIAQRYCTTWWNREKKLCKIWCPQKHHSILLFLKTVMSEGAAVCQCLILVITIWLVIGSIVSNFNSPRSKSRPIDFIPEVLEPTLKNQTGNFSDAD